MPLILAIEPDRRQAAQLSAVVKKRVSAELILVDTTERALDAIGNRMPDLVLVPALLSPQDDAALAGALRIIAAAARVQMLTIPVLGAARPAPRPGGVLSALRRGKARAVEHDGCDPGVFAEQIASYLEHAAQERGEETESIPDAAESSAQPVETATGSDGPAADVVQAVDAAEAAVVEDFTAVDEIFVEGAAAIEVGIAPVVQPVYDAAPRAEESIGSEWTDVVLALDEPPMTAAADESVSIALEEAVRALFAEGPVAQLPAPPVVEPETAPAGEPDFEPAAELPVPLAAAEPSAPNATEWAAVEELMAALEAIPLVAFELSEDDDLPGPLVEEPDRSDDQPERVIEDPDGDDIDLTPELKDADGQPVMLPIAAARSEREWVALIESLRHDVERLRVERAEKPPQKPAPPPPVRANKAGRKAKPVQDEWGFFDPEQCGFAALLAKLDEVTEADEGRI